MRWWTGFINCKELLPSIVVKTKWEVIFSAFKKTWYIINIQISHSHRNTRNEICLLSIELSDFLGLTVWFICNLPNRRIPSTRIYTYQSHSNTQGLCQGTGFQWGVCVCVCVCCNCKLHFSFPQRCHLHLVATASLDSKKSNLCLLHRVCSLSHSHSLSPKNSPLQVAAKGVCHLWSLCPAPSWQPHHLDSLKFGPGTEGSISCFPVDASES
jgi:hypothetical protein